MKTISTLLSCILAIFTFLTSHAQSLRGKVIYISPSQEVKLKFKSAIASYGFVNKNEANYFKIKSSNKKNLLINSISATSKHAYLSITEGENTHLFILAYSGRQEPESEVVYDLSSKEKLEQELYKMSVASNPPSQKNILVKNAASTQSTKVPVTQAVNKIESRPEQTEANTPPADPVTPKDSQAKEVKPSAQVPITNNTTPVNNTTTNKTAETKTETKHAPLNKPLNQQPNTPPLTNTSITLSTQSSLPAEPTLNKDSINYEKFIHYGDSTAWINKDYKSALKWYDSAQKINPQALLPRKQAKVVKQLQLEKEMLEAKKTRETNFNNALEHYKKGEAFRLERNYPESYKEFGEFLKMVDTADLNSYMSSQLYYINMAKGFRERLFIHLPKVKEEPVVTPADDQKKRKKRKD